MPAPDLSVVMPSYQLGAVIEPNVRRVLASLSAQPAHEVVVVDDGSTDGTSRALAALAEVDDRLKVVRHDVNRGKGRALVSGWQASQGDHVVFLDADLDLPPEQIPELLIHLVDADVVVGTKREAMSRRNYPWLRTLLSRVYAASTSGLFRLPVRETQTGLKVFRRSVLDRILPDMRIFGYAFDLELLIRADRLGARMVEVPVSLADAAKESSFRLAMAWELARDTVRLGLWTLTDAGLRRSSARSLPGA